MTNKKDIRDYNINDYNPTDQLILLKEICNTIYIARNISLSEQTIIDQLKRLDQLFRDKDNFN
jgi:hypothetical protein